MSGAPGWLGTPPDGTILGWEMRMLRQDATGALATYLRYLEISCSTFFSGDIVWDSPSEGIVGSQNWSMLVFFGIFILQHPLWAPIHETYETLTGAASTNSSGVLERGFGWLFSHEFLRLGFFRFLGSCKFFMAFCNFTSLEIMKTRRSVEAES